MKPTRNRFAFAAALTLMAATMAFTACQEADENAGNIPAGSIPLVLGEVSVGVPTSSMRAGGHTRALTENSTGYTGIPVDNLAAAYAAVTATGTTLPDVKTVHWSAGYTLNVLTNVIVLRCWHVKC